MRKKYMQLPEDPAKQDPTTPPPSHKSPPPDEENELMRKHPTIKEPNHEPTIKDPYEHPRHKDIVKQYC